MENIRAIQELLEQIYSLSEPFSSFVEDQLSQLSPQDWWQHCVINKINERYSHFQYNKVLNTISDLDLSQKIQVLFDNWYQLYNHSPSFHIKYTHNNKELLKYVRDIRNEIAHQDYYSGNNFERFKKDCELLSKFATFINTDIETCLTNMHKKEKTKILSLITKKVLEPALNCKTLDDKTKASVLDTYRRLESSTRAREIVDFFYSALKGIRGKEVCSNLHASHLLAFEDIKEEINYLYFGDDEYLNQ